MQGFGFLKPVFRGVPIFYFIDQYRESRGGGKMQVT